MPRPLGLTESFLESGTKIVIKENGHGGKQRGVR